MIITKITVQQVSTILSGLMGIYKEDIPSYTTYWLVRDRDWLESEGKRLEKQRIAIVMKYVKKDKDGKPILKNEGKAYDIENEKEFNKEINELLESKVDIKLRTFKLNDFGKAYISMENLVKIKPIIEDWEEESKAWLDLSNKKKSKR
ncbi:MAG TPA: hypothetical protein VMV86_01445 [Methanosarcinales archaeon]|nr:hypothetical protein [Methanosarcinales archaeon]